MTNTEYLWNMFTPELGEIGAAAVLGNLQAESAMNPKNLQNSYERKLGYNDESYTQAVDSGKYSLDKFAHDSAGYGLAQWTHWSRKTSLYQHTIAIGHSVGDLTAQGRFVLEELRSYGLTKQLQQSTDLYEATALVLRRYERPADQSDANCKRRAKLSQEIYDKYHSKPEDGTLGIIEELDALSERLKKLANELRSIK